WKRLSEITESIEKGVGFALAVSRYLRAADRFQQASGDFTCACKSLRKQLGSGQRFVVQVDFKHYLVTSDNDGNFDIEAIQSL
ncbi:MAG: hypothetical protein GY783_09630, partial [Gammaproteobacteria bacterium]|nr:hypothetical protein [Gammaproteobacteria bacterium]